MNIAPCFCSSRDTREGAVKLLCICSGRRYVQETHGERCFNRERVYEEVPLRLVSL